MFWRRRQCLRLEAHSGFFTFIVKEQKSSRARVNHIANVLQKITALSVERLFTRDSICFYSKCDFTNFTCL